MQLNTILLNDYCKIYVADPEYTDVDALAAYVRVHRTELMQELCTRQISQNPYPIRVLPS